MTNCPRNRRAFYRFTFLVWLAFSPYPSTAATGDAGASLAIERGLPFLQKEALTWKETRKCAACHHAAMVVWTFNEAKAAGYPVDDKLLKEVSEWSFGDMETNSLMVQAAPRDVVNLGWVYVLLAMETAPGFARNAPAAPASLPGLARPGDSHDDSIEPARRVLIQQIIAKQADDGSWGKPLDERVPLGGPVEDIAALCRLALLQTGDSSPSVVTCGRKAASWLAAHKDKISRQGRNFRLLMSLREGESPKELTRQIEAIAAEQNVDGGWSQTPEMASDAYATGQTLYVLARAGAKPGATVMRRGLDFLTRTQREDGSWPMQSRVHAKNLSPITASGTAWAMLGLIRSCPR